MGKYYLISKTHRGPVTIDKEELTFNEKGVATTESEDTYAAAKNLSSLGISALTEEEMQELLSKKKAKDGAQGVNPDSTPKDGAQGEQQDVTGGDGAQGAKQEITPKERKAMEKQLSDLKKKWDSTEDEAEKANLKTEIEELENKLK